MQQPLILALALDFPDISNRTGKHKQQAQKQDGVKARQPGHVSQQQHRHAHINHRQTNQFVDKSLHTTSFITFSGAKLLKKFG